jgi:DEAD/DEAH box helicase domain-containing protein
MRGRKKIPELFRGALKVLQDCPCGAEHEKDGCYRCLYAYRVSRDMNALSRSTAIELLSQIVEKKDSFEKTTSLKTVSLSSLFDSELEERFIDNLKKPRIGQTPPELSSKTVNGRPGYSFKVGDRQWDIEIHANVGEREGVSVPSEVDFLFKPVGGDNEGVLPLAVFTDGFAYHANITNGKYRVGKDFAQRMALVKSGKYRVWSLTFEDVKHKTGEEPKYCLSPFGKATRTRAKIYDQFDAAKKVKKLSKVHLEGAFDNLLRYLNDPDLVAWQSTAFIEALLLSGTPMKVDDQTFRLWDGRLRGEEESELGAEIVRSESPTYAIGRKLSQYASGETGLVTLSAVELQAINSADAEKMNLICRLADEGEKISKKEEFQPMWNGALTCYNLMQFLPRALLLNTRGIEEGATPEELLVDEELVEAPNTSPWSEVHSLALPEFRDLAKKLDEAGKDVPEVGYEFTRSNGEVVGTAEFAWPARKIAVCTAAEKEQGKLPDDWEVFGLEGLNEILEKL